MKQTCLINAKKDEKGIAGQARNDRSFRMKNLFILVIFLALMACNRNPKVVEEESAEIITVDVTKSYPPKELHLQDIADVKYIPLGSNNEFLIGDGYRIAYIDTAIIILFNNGKGESGTNGGDILIFDTNGNPITHINRRGQNTGQEYFEIGQVLMDKEKEELFVTFYHSHQRFMVYDMQGNFKRKFDIPSSFNRTIYDDFMDYDKGHFIVYAKNNYLKPDSTTFLILSKQNGEILKNIAVPFEKIVYTTVFNARGSGGAFFIYHAINPVESGVLLTELSADTIYHLSADYQLSPYMARTPSIQSMDKHAFLLVEAISHRYLFLNIVVKVEVNFDDDIFNLRSPFQRTPIVYDKAEKEIYQYTLINDDYYPTQKRVGMINSMDVKYFKQDENATMAVLFQAYKLIEANEKGELKGELKEIASQLTEDDNPVLMIAKFK
jgi:hypothetical protein